MKVLTSPEPRSDLPALERGLVHLRAGEYAQAIAILSDALAREPGRIATVRGLATALLLSGNARDARKSLFTFTRDQPLCAEGWKLAAQLEWKLGERSEAISMLRHGLKRLPQSDCLKQTLVVFLAAEGKSIDAAPRVQSAVADEDLLDEIVRDPVLLKSLVPAHSKVIADGPEREMAERLECKLTASLQSQPRHADRQLLLAQLRRWLGNISGAMDAIDLALAANDALIEAHRLRAQLLAHLDRIPEAVAVLKGLIAARITWPDVHYELAELEAKLGRTPEARNHLYSAIRFNPRFEQARELLERCAA